MAADGFIFLGVNMYSLKVYGLPNAHYDRVVDNIDDDSFTFSIYDLISATNLCWCVHRDEYVDIIYDIKNRERRKTKDLIFAL